MTVIPGMRLGSYEIHSLIAAGGMGEVYRARDTRLHRDVALKLLRSDYEVGAERLRRFEQEARAAASLNHPNILSVYDIGSQDGMTFIVSELLEGQTVREALAVGPLLLSRVLQYAVQIADGLAAAHGKGIVHRDLKPENLFLTKDDWIKILDFGLAKLRKPQAHADDATVGGSTFDTQAGAVMGTAGYMAPEQVRGDAVDHRADIFSFGVVVYEMLTRRRAFEGESPIESMHAIVHDDPPSLSGSAIGSIPAALELIVLRCLEKQPERRFQTASDLAFALRTLSPVSGAAPTVDTLAVPAPKRGYWPLHGGALAAAVTALLILMVAGVWFLARPAPSDGALRRMTMALSDGAQTLYGLALSPDGRRVVFSATGVDGQPKLYLRSFDDDAARPLTGTEDGRWPFWSPDSDVIAFFAAGKLKKVGLSGTPPETITDAESVTASGAWNDRGVILFSEGSSGLNRVAATGGPVVKVTVLDEGRQEALHRFPSFLPDGNHFVFLAVNRDREKSVLCIGSLESPAADRLTVANSMAVYAEPGYLLYARGSTLVAHGFDPTTRTLTGEPIALAQSIARLAGGAAFSVANDRTLVFSEVGDPMGELVWVDRQGRRGDIVAAGARFYSPALSPSGKMLVVERTELGQQFGDLWLFDLIRGVPSRFTDDPRMETSPVWSPDGDRVAYTVVLAGNREIRTKLMDGDEKPETLTTPSEAGVYPQDWAASGEFLLATVEALATQEDIWLFSTRPGGTPRPVLATNKRERSPRLSPDGRWLAYSSDETDAFEIYVRPFPQLDKRWRISLQGGTEPLWRRDGRELFYLSSDGKMMSVSVAADNGPVFKSSAPVPLFSLPARPAATVRDRNYGVTPDGQRFLMNLRVNDPRPATLNVFLNWPTALKP